MRAAVVDGAVRGELAPVDLRLASDLPLAVAAYRRCDVLVVNAVADGMNLAAKEAVVVNERDMVLALSESPGCMANLGATMHPFDIAQQADALHQALTMPQQQRSQLLRAAAEVVRHNDVQRWLTIQLTDLASIATDADHSATPTSAPGAPRE